MTGATATSLSPIFALSAEADRRALIVSIHEYRCLPGNVGGTSTANSGKTKKHDAAAVEKSVIEGARLEGNGDGPEKRSPIGYMPWRVI